MSADEALLDAIERQVMEYDMSVSIKRCVSNAHRPDAWQVVFKTDAALVNGQGGKTWAAGGGRTLREAFEKAFLGVVTKRLT